MVVLQWADFAADLWWADLRVENVIRLTRIRIVITGFLEHTIEPPRDIDYRSIKSAINRNTLILSASKISDSFGGGLSQSFGGLGLGSSLSTPHKVVTDDAG